jgi:hypothetical protein
VIVLSSESERAIMVGDVIHCPLELTDPRFSISADVDAAAAHESKRRLAAEASDGSTRLFSTHFPAMRPGRLREDGAVRRWSWDQDD